MNTAILSSTPLDFLWPTTNPFLFCAHHIDQYPAGGENFGPPPSSLKGRDIGQDFTIKDGWRMYHGQTVPGFPVHPHRGFETVTIVLQGMVDHSDSHGQAGRYGEGDVQWMTAGAGLQHCEMFPLLNRDKENPAELFQLWLNLPKDKKFAEPHFKMLWSEDIPLVKIQDEKGKTTEIKIIAGSLGDVKALAPAPDSWANEPENEVGIWMIKMEAGAQWTLPPASDKAKRNIYFYKGSSMHLNEDQILAENAIEIKADAEVKITNDIETGYFLLLQGIPIDEPVVQYGPFVMNTQEEIRKAIYDYQMTEFGGWPWPRPDVVHPRERGRFARHKDGAEEVRSKREEACLRDAVRQGRG